jgi:hypothetical protein
MLPAVLIRFVSGIEEFPGLYFEWFMIWIEVSLEKEGLIECFETQAYCNPLGGQETPLSMFTSSKIIWFIVLIFFCN